MNSIAIHTDGLGKQYRIGKQSPSTSLRDSLASLGSFRKKDAVEEPASIWALKDLALDIHQGEVVGIIGRNGAGKTTFLKLLSRITAPTEGSFDVYGRVGSLLEVGTGFHPDLTGRENVYFNGAILGMKRSEIRRKFDEIVAFAELEKFIDTPVKRYSSGMYLRLAFAVAAYLDPEILLADEVLAVGDASFQRKCLGKMRDVSAQGRTVLFVSHNMPAITRLCQRAILLENGRLLKDGAATEVAEFYLERVIEAGGSRRWEDDAAPGTDELKLTAVKLLKENGSSASLVEVNEPLKLSVTYKVNQPSMCFRCHIHFYTQGVCAFSCVEPTEEVRHKTGLYQSVLHLPPHLFAEGEYSVMVTFFSSKGMKKRYFLLRDAIVFQVFDPMTGLSARGDYVQKMPGVVRPLLNWELSCEEKQIINSSVSSGTDYIARASE